MRISLGENAKMALDTLRENKLRSFLTVLGVVIGITALITVVVHPGGFLRGCHRVSERLRREHHLDLQSCPRDQHRTNDRRGAQPQAADL